MPDDVDDTPDDTGDDAPPADPGWIDGVEATITNTLQNALAAILGPAPAGIPNADGSSTTSGWNQQPSASNPNGSTLAQDVSVAGDDVAAKLKAFLPSWVYWVAGSVGVLAVIGVTGYALNSVARVEGK